MSRHRNILLMVVFVVMAVLACIPAENINADNKYISSAWNGTADVAEETDAGADADLGYPEVYTYENVVALTFDDGPGQSTEKLLDGLKERNVKATFFLVGENIEGNEEIVKRMYDEGHLIGNHTFSHVQLTAVSEGKALEEVNETNEAIKAITGVRPYYIRPPYGMLSSCMAEEIDMQSVLWTVDPEDWNTSDCGAVVRHVVKNAKNGDIILMHDIFDSSVTAALEIVDRLKERGYVFVTADQLILD
jgi:peptidoglycan/xylan/chitin deacetylase (PgdA/CDA1 family)|nr:MAG TPA: hypothetical protein [Caudoviricetes sp.]